MIREDMMLFRPYSFKCDVRVTYDVRQYKYLVSSKSQLESFIKALETIRDNAIKYNIPVRVEGVDGNLNIIHTGEEGIVIYTCLHCLRCHPFIVFLGYPCKGVKCIDRVLDKAKRKLGEYDKVLSELEDVRERMIKAGFWYKVDRRNMGGGL